MPGDNDELVVGLDVAAKPGMRLDEVATPALIVDLDAFERNVERLRAFVAENGMRLRAHAKTHKSADIARYQIEKGGACGVCCQKVSEAQALVAAGIKDVLVSNQVVDRRQIGHLADLARDARVIVCVDDASNVDALSQAAQQAGTTIECLVEIDVGAGRCGVPWGPPATALAGKIAQSRGLKFSGLQAYQGSAQHKRSWPERKQLIDEAIDQTRKTVAMLEAEGLPCDIVGGAGTGTYRLESTSGVYNELQCGSYVFMDADYGRVLDEGGRPKSDFENALFILTTVMSKAKPGQAICDAGLKVQSVDSGQPVVFEGAGLEFLKCSDEHGVIADPEDRLSLGDKLKLVPGHCDPTCNLHDYYVCMRGDIVECLWPVTARGRAF
ncbi:MAG: DSD1 family PLP-dependent enzyme [Alphaproteobacteria bacterium]|nr:DSD1 family PLP-dependent enzyme [Alphaproteobacteria bacterium]